MRIVISGTILALAAALTTPAASAAPVATLDVSLPAAVPAPDVDAITVPAAPADAEVRQDEGEGDLVAELPARRTGEFSLVGVTWNEGVDARGLEVLVRSRSAGTWTSWQDLHVEAAPGEGGRGGTEPWWVGEADGVAVRVTSPSGERPAGLAVTTVESDEVASDTLTTPVIAATPAADSTPTYTPQPKIISRSSWGARKNTSCDSPVAGDETRGVTVHHTAGSNSYSKSKAASIVRGVQAFHMKGRKWCDIGYNFLVDKYGQIFEGRNGGIDRAVRAAHAGDRDVNTYAMGVSMMGTYSKKEPSADTKTAMVKLIGWRLGTTYHPATGTVKIGKKTYNRIAGHRNVVSTECPGTAAYKWLSRSGGLRDRVKTYISDYDSAAKDKVKDLGSAVTGPVFVGEYPFASSVGGRKVRLKNLDVYSTSLGTFAVALAVRDEYRSHDSQAGVLGVPTGELVPIGSTRVAQQSFEHGTIYQVTASTTKAYALAQGLDAEYQRLGGPAGELGAPTARYTSVGSGVYRATFEGGTLTRNADGTFTYAPA